MTTMYDRIKWNTLKSLEYDSKEGETLTAETTEEGGEVEISIVKQPGSGFYVYLDFKEYVSIPLPEEITQKPKVTDEIVKTALQSVPGYPTE